jgi:osmotically-inducible protein OsmY
MRTLALVSIFAALVAAGCNSADTDKISEDAKGMAKSASETIAGMTLVGKVNTALDLRKDVDTKTLHIEAKDGLVTVTGTVKSSDEKGRVYDLINNTVGVDKVDDTGLKVEK